MLGCAESAGRCQSPEVQIMFLENHAVMLETSRDSVTRKPAPGATPLPCRSLSGLGSTNKNARPIHVSGTLGCAGVEVLGLKRGMLFPGRQEATLPPLWAPRACEQQPDL